MKKFLDYLLEKDEWNRIKPSDLPPLNKEYVAKKKAERNEIDAATKEVRSKTPDEISGNDETPMDIARIDKPDSYEGRIRDRYRREASGAGTVFVKPKMPGDEYRQTHRQAPKPSYNDTPTINEPSGTADKGIEPKDTSIMNPSRRARTKT